METLKKLVLETARKLNWLPPLVARVSVGFVFVQTGWGKLHHLDKVIEFFRTLGIPQPQLQAPFVASVELICGAMVLAGLFTRLAAIPLIGVMVVAIMTAKLKYLEGISGLFGLSEYLYIVIFLWLFTAGPGAVSADQFVCKRCAGTE